MSCCFRGTGNMDGRQEQKLRQAMALRERLIDDRSTVDCFVRFGANGGTVVDTGLATGWRARAHGITSTCTGGPDGALRNWCENVARRAAKAERQRSGGRD